MTAPKKRGFTLIELLVVIGVLAVLISIVLIAVNPAEQLNRANDVSAKATASEFIKASMQEYTVSKSLPWDSDSACQTEMESGETLADMPACIHALINDEKLESNFKESSNLNELHVTKCGKSAVICYSPKSKVEYEQTEAKYNKFGVSQPGCPGHGGSSEQCYWCRPIHNDPTCLIDPIPTPTALPTNAPIVTPTLTPTLLPTATPTLTSTPTTCPYKIGQYCLDDTKFLQTYAVLAFSYPGFPAKTTQKDQDGGVDSGWMVDVSFRPDFGGTTSVVGFGYSVNGVPVTTNADTVLWASGGGDFFADWAAPEIKAHQTNLTSKHFAFLSMPYHWGKYVNGCGKTIYWRVVNFRTGIPGINYSSNKFSPTYTGTVDCTTKVGVWVGYYYPTSDISGDGIINYTDYIIGALQTKSRAGGWQPPE